MASLSFTAFNSVATNTASTAVAISGGGAELGRPEPSVQVEFGTATGTVAIQGRLDSSLSWVTLDTTTANKIVRVGNVKEVRLSISGIGGTGGITGGVLQ